MKSAVWDFSRMLSFVFYRVFLPARGRGMGNCKVVQWIDQGRPGAVSLLLNTVSFHQLFFKVLTWKKAAKTSTIIFPVEKKMFQRMRIKDVWSSCFFPVDSDKKFPKNAADSPHHPGYAWV